MSLTREEIASIYKNGMTTQGFAELTRRLESYTPASVLAVGPGSGALLGTYQNAHPECQVTYLDPHGTLEGNALLEALAGKGRFDFVMVRGVLERVDADTGANLLARLRDVHTSRFCVALCRPRGERRWQAEALIAMGLVLWSSEALNAARLEIYGFDLGTYKSTPDWLNARHWAHPEHWGKYRW